jgi:SAM-dependent methyltransferase
MTDHIFAQILGELTPGLILDVATSEGGFIGVLKQHLKSWGQITGIDLSQERLDTARQHHPEENIDFLFMDAAQLNFPDQHFDMVAIGVSLHHLLDIPNVLAEMLRVLKPGGYFFVTEMHASTNSEASHTLALLHQWAADIDTVEGISHNHTLARQQIIDYIAPLGLTNLQVLDAPPDDSDPFKNLEDFDLDGFIERFSARAAKAGYPDLVGTGKELKQRTQKTGIQSEPRLYLIGQKP